MLQLRVVQAKYGDCLILENEIGGRRRYVLVDGGPSEPYAKNLRRVVEDIGKAGGQIDLMVLTHVDNDHVMGLLKLTNDLKKAQTPFVRISAMWHNGFGKFLIDYPDEASPAETREKQKKAKQLENRMLNTPAVISKPRPAADPAAAAPTARGEVVESDEPLMEEIGSYGISQGYDLLKNLKGLRCRVNANLPSRLVVRDTAPRPVRLAGMRLSVLGPSQAHLDVLRQMWEAWLTEEGLSFAPGKQLQPDDSETNLSSIMFLAEAGGRKILLTGDGLGDDVVAALDALYPAQAGKIHTVDILKLPHHGSARNCVGALFDRVQASTYVICADGSNGNPDDQTLEWLIDAACRQGRDIVLFATNDTESLQRLVVKRPPAQNHYRLDILPEGKSSQLL